MRHVRFFGSIILVSLLISCASTSKRGLEQRNEPVSISINAASLEVFDATSQVLIQNGFSILSTNERLGLITTDYKEIKQTAGNSFFEGIFGIEDTQVMLSTNIRPTEMGCVLNILPKGRTKKSKKKDYVEITLSRKFIDNIVALGEDIKVISESNSTGVPDNKSRSSKDSRDLMRKDNSPNPGPGNYSKSLKVRIIASNANVRIKPEKQSKVISSVPLGAILEVQKKEGEWYLVMLPIAQGGFNITGYIHQSTVEEHR